MESESSSGSVTTSFDWSDNASWRTHFDDSYSFENSVYSSGTYAVQRSLSQLSVLTAEPIDYDCTVGEIDFKPSVFSESPCSCGLSSTNSVPVTSVKQLVPGNPEAMNFGDAGYKKGGKDSDYQQSSFYHFMDMNEGPVDLTPRITHVASQYHMPEMFEYNAVGYQKNYNIDVTKIDVDKNTEVNEIKSTYCMDG